MKDARRQHGIGLALNHTLGKMLERAHAAARDDGDWHRARHGTGECQVEASLGAVAIHAGEQDLTGAATSRFLGPRHRIDTRGVATAGREDLPPIGTGCAGQAHTLGIDRHDHGLAAKRRGGLADQRRIAHGGRVERHLVGAGGNHSPHARQVAKTAAHGIGNSELLGRVRRHLDGRRAVVARRGNVQKNDLVRTLAVVGAGQLHRVARIAQAHKVDALDHAAVLDVQAGNHAFGKHGLLLPSGGGQRLGQRKIALVERTAGNGALDGILAHRGQCADIVERRDAA